MAGSYIELCSGFSFKKEEKKLVCVRSFVWNPDDDGGLAQADLPAIGSKLVLNGDPFFAMGIAKTYDHTFCRQSRYGYLAGDLRKCKRTYTYTNDPIDESIFASETQDVDAFPMVTRMEFGTDVITANPATNIGEGEPVGDQTKIWVWQSDGTKCSLPIPFYVSSGSITAERLISDDKIDKFRDLSLKYIGTVNALSSTPHLTDIGSQPSSFNSIPSLFSASPGCWLYLGHQEEPYTNDGDERMWRCILTFSFRDPQLDDGIPQTIVCPHANGWYKLLRTTINGATGESITQWDIPYWADPALPTQKRYTYKSAEDSVFYDLIGPIE